MYQQYRFVMANGMKVKFRAFNGAPNLKMDTKASVFGEKESYIAYYMLDKDRPKTPEERWSLELRNTPSVKFRVIMLADNDPESKDLGMATVDRTFIDIDDVYKRYVGAALYRTTTVNTLVAYTTEFIAKKKEEGKLKSDDDIIRECYYCLRKVFLEMYYKGPVHSELEKYMTGKKLYKKVLKQQEKDEQKKEEREDEIRINAVVFATSLRMALAAQNIQSELFVYMPRKLGAWRDAVFLDELDFVMKVKSKRRNYFLEAFNNFDAFASPYSYLEGTEGYSIGYAEPNQYYKTPGPSTTYQENVARKDYEVKFADGMDIINVQRTSILTGYTKPVLTFHSKSGPLSITREREYFLMDFPSWKPQRFNDHPAGLEEALGIKEIVGVYKHRDLVVELETEEDVRKSKPDFGLLKKIGTEVIITAPGKEVDFVSRFFAPGFGIDEDPVTGSAHSQLIPFWSEKLGKKKMVARQLSARGGELQVEQKGERVMMGGQCAYYMKGQIVIPDQPR
ncbi:phenazine biosynthesis protein, PhzF family [Ostertagia ostertagi]